MLLVFPTYQLLATIGLLAIIVSFQGSEVSIIFTFLGLLLSVLFGIPVLLSWHLSFLLFVVGYLGFAASFGFPFTRWVKAELEGAVNWFRPKM